MSNPRRAYDWRAESDADCDESRDSFRLISTLRSGWRGRLCYVLAHALKMHINPINTSGLYKSSLTASAPITVTYSNLGMHILTLRSP